MAKGKFIDVTLRLIDNMSSGLNRAGQALARHANQYQKAGRQIQNAGKSISNVGASLTKTVTTPIVALGAASVKSFGEVDKTMRLIEQTMGRTKWATADLEKEIKKAASKSVFSMQEATDATLNFARQGFNAKKSAQMLTPALDLAAGTATDLSQVTSGLGNTMKVFASQGLTAKQAADIFAKAQAQANTTTTELFDAMSVGAPIFKSVGWSMQDLATVTGVFGDNSITGSEGANAMKTGLARLMSPAKDGAAWMKKLNLELVDSNGNMKSMKNVQSQLHSSFSKLTQEQQIQAASALFGKNQMSKWLTLIGTSPKTIDQYRTSLDKASNTSSKMGNALMNGVGGSIEKLKSTFDVFKYSFGEAISGPVKKVVDKLTSLIDKFNNLDPAMQKNIAKMLGIAAAVGPAIFAFGKMVKLVGSVYMKLSTLGKWFKTFGSLAGILTSPAGIVIGVLAGVAAAAVLIYKNWDKLKPTFEKVAKALEPVKKVFMQVAKQVVKSVQDMIKKVTSAFKKVQSVLKMAISFCGKVGSVISKVLTKAIKSAMPVVKKIGEIFNTVFSAIVQIVSNAVSVVAGVISKLTHAFQVAFSVSGEWVSFLGNTISSIFDGVMTKLGGILDFITGTFTENWSTAWEGVKNIFSGVFNSFATLCKTPINAVISIINGAIKGINKINVDIPDWVPGVGGDKLGFNIPTIPALAKGTENWKGGIVQISEKGGEIVDLPSGSRVYPHDKSVKKAYNDGAKSSEKKVVIKIERLADRIIVREEADIDKIVRKLADKLEKKSQNTGGGEIGYVF